MGLPSLLTHPSDPLGRLAAAGAALVVEPGVAAITGGLRRLNAMAVAERRAMGERARAVVAAEFPWERGARVLADAYARHAREDQPGFFGKRVTPAGI
jgi:glycosyltransferase involved in cell wall biosynthesis